MNPWLTPEQVEAIRADYTTLPTDGNGEVIGVIYGTLKVRRDITLLVAEVKRLQELVRS